MVVWERGAGPTLACGTGAHPRAAPGCLRAAPDASREDLQQTAPASSGTDGQMQEGSGAPATGGFTSGHPSCR